MNFFDLQEKEKCLIIGNVWNPLSAMILEQAGFSALGTTSWGIANSLGYNDGQKITFSSYFNVIQEIKRVTKVPISVDIESGFSDKNEQVIKNILLLADIGCSGINIEDAVNKTLIHKEQQVQLLNNIKNTLIKEGYPDFFINARIDTYLLLDNPIDETRLRVKIYESAGVDGVFIPGLTKLDEIKEISDLVNIPLNIMMLPDCEINKLISAGARRISFGNAISDSVISHIERIAESILKQQNTKTLFMHGKIKTKFSD